MRIRLLSSLLLVRAISTAQDACLRGDCVADQGEMRHDDGSRCCSP